MALKYPPPPSEEGMRCLLEEMRDGGRTLSFDGLLELFWEYYRKFDEHGGIDLAQLDTSAVELEQLRIQALVRTVYYLEELAKRLLDQEKTPGVPREQRLLLSRLAREQASDLRTELLEHHHPPLGR